jgi:hypothetical protein
MKASLFTFIITCSLFAQNSNSKEFNFYEDLPHYSQDQKLVSKEKQYQDKIHYLEIELGKYKERLVEKSLNLEKTQEGLRTKYEQEIAFLKREVVYKTKSLFEAQRQLEKINPSEDMKNLVRLNTEMAAQIRGTQDQMAISQLKNDHGRVPASVKSK